MFNYKLGCINQWILMSNILICYYGLSFDKWKSIPYSARIQRIIKKGFMKNRSYVEFINDHILLYGVFWVMQFGN